MTFERRLTALEAHCYATPADCTHGCHVVTRDISLDALRNRPETTDAPDETEPACGVCGLPQAMIVIEIVTGAGFLYA